MASGPPSQAEISQALAVLQRATAHSFGPMGNGASSNPNPYAKENYVAAAAAPTAPTVAEDATVISASGSNLSLLDASDAPGGRKNSKVNDLAAMFGGTVRRSNADTQGDGLWRRARTGS